MLSIMDEKIAHVHAHTHAHTHTRKPLFLDSQKGLSSPPLPGPGVEGRSFFVRYPPRPPGAGQPVRVPGGGGQPALIPSRAPWQASSRSQR